MPVGGIQLVEQITYVSIERPSYSSLKNMKVVKSLDHPDGDTRAESENIESLAVTFQ